MSKWILSRPHSTARAYGPPRPRGTRRFLAATSKRCLGARGLTANWRKSVLLSRCAKCAGRIVGRYYVPEMLATFRIKKIARFYFSLLFAPIDSSSFSRTSPEETFLASQGMSHPPGHVSSTSTARTVPRDGISQDRAIPDGLDSGLSARRVRVRTSDCCWLLDRWWPRQ